jgi:DNA-directed RNA polymerase subunit M/transcription elongation factor TFIIS
MNLKCTECGSSLKKETITEDQVIVCPTCDAQYKLTSTPDGKQRLEEFTFGDDDPGEL